MLCWQHEHACAANDHAVTVTTDSLDAYRKFSGTCGWSPTLEIRPEIVESLADDIVHALCSLERLARLDLRHGLGVLRALGGVIDLGVAQCQRDRAVAHQLFHHFERGSSIEELRRKSVPQCMGRIGLGNPCALEILG